MSGKEHRKTAAGYSDMSISRTFLELDALHGSLPPAPRDCGRVVQVCVRPGLNERAFPETIDLCPDRGAIGDRWEQRTWIYLPNGRPDPRVQVAISHGPTMTWIQELTQCTHHPGDTLLVDLDLSAENLPCGTLLRAGSAIIEVSDIENDGCEKFAIRHGVDVLSWIRSPENRVRRLRGLFARVIVGGSVRAGDKFGRLTC